MNTLMQDTHRQTTSKEYKFRELRVYASTEWLADNKKKYRQVFDRHDTTYIYTELSFYNKRFDDIDWDVNVELKCFSLKKGKKELCALSFERKVSKYDNIVYIREGWGNKTLGAFWKKGTYYWEAWIEGEKVGTKYFYIEDAGREITAYENPYVEVTSIKLYEGPYDDIPLPERIYYKTFSSEESRYIYVELMLENLSLVKHWQCELFIKFYNDARELKGQIIKLQKIEKETTYVQFTAGWGSNVRGSWRKDRYTAEVVFMDRLLAIVPFEVDDDFEEGTSQVYIPNRRVPLFIMPDEDPSVTFEDVVQDLDGLIGLKDIKRQVREHAKYIQFLQLRRKKGFEEKEGVNVHSVFVGNPGTGKTTVAKMMGKLYKKMGLLSKGHVFEVDRVDLVGEYIGQTAPKVKDAIEKARGGVLFIDEAYSLARTSEDSKDFGREVLEVLVKEMSNGAGDLAVIVAGYPKEMKNFLDTNPGLKSRFKLHFEFADYLPQELIQIAEYACKEKGVSLTEEAKLRVGEMITEAYRTRDRTFGNARFVYDIIEKSKIQLGLRIMSLPEPSSVDRAELASIEWSDVANLDVKPSPELPSIPIDEIQLQKALNELNQLVGITSVKKQILELVELVRYYRFINKNVLHNFFLHTLFVGNPGTGKTTVARILTQIYKALGVLERGQMVETDRQGLVAGYVGQTAIKTSEKIDEAIGGVLFIDEAYSLTVRGSATHGDFGDEVIQTLLKRMEDQRGRFFVFAAGYPDNMDSFLKANPGLTSRFDKILKFEDYTAEELYQIALAILQEQKIYPTPEADEHLKKYFYYLHNFRDKYFGNARAVRQIITDAIKHQHLRLAALSEDDRLHTSIYMLTLEDVEPCTTDKNGFTIDKKSIGFKK